MLKRRAPAAAPTSSRSVQLPQRRWRIRSPRALVGGVVGAAIGALVPFLAWWFMDFPLWPMVFTALLGWYLLLPPTLWLGLDEQGAALIVPTWNRDNYLWLPRERLVRLEIKQGWLLATGSNVEQQGNLNWPDIARQAGATIPSWLNLHSHSPIAPTQLAAPIHLLDELARDEIELWLYRQGKVD